MREPVGCAQNLRHRVQAGRHEVEVTSRSHERSIHCWGTRASCLSHRNLVVQSIAHEQGPCRFVTSDEDRLLLRVLGANACLGGEPQRFASNVTADDFTLTTASGTATGNIVSTSGSGTSHTVTVDTIAGTGSLRLDLNASTDIVDDDGNGNNTNGYVSAFSSGTAHTVDRDAPTVAITTGSTTSFNQSAPGSFTATITFSESVTGFTDGDLTASNATVGSISGSGTTYTATITPNGNGNVALNVAAGVAQDAASNINVEATQVTVTQTDDVAPTVAIATDSGGSFNESAPGTFTATITFNEAVSGFTPVEITATNGTVAGAFATGADGDSVYTIVVTPAGNRQCSFERRCRCGAGRSIQHQYRRDTGYRDTDR